MVVVVVVVVVVAAAVAAVGRWVGRRFGGCRVQWHEQLVLAPGSLLEETRAWWNHERVGFCCCSPFDP